MQEDTKSVFISYSWDSPEHQQWVMDLVDLLRENGVDASFDMLETQSQTVNLNAMMVSNVRDNDYTVIVLTENYKKKAEALQGGVGFETLLTMPLLMKNPNKLILIVRHAGNFESVVPFHLDGWYAINFSDDANFERAFKELHYRIEGVPLYEKKPLGKKPKLTPLKGIVEKPGIDFSDFDIPSLKRITDLEKEKFINESFQEMNTIFKELFSQMKQSNSNFDFTVENGEAKFVYKLYVNGNVKSGLKVWLSNDFATTSIKMAYGHLSVSPLDNSYNESIVCEVNEKNELALKMQMNMFGGKDTNEPLSIVKTVWKNHITPYIS
ncbi:TPA: toll/interleukin-1 receptor domain-containing protein [Bacillus cereus]|uniref:toll/interleukin-1 receptor domain-containing protein n=1 Tax=Bacillus cereus group TaxID=86661 RepID=UPI0001A03373|nr:MULTISPECIES: toll/interleukin-1 receptor domain-containing protein [Bacillus cereus group]EEK65629.1 SEFIR domain containing protein [Bacillus wiedmannii]KMQ12507.1 hypothetical protein TU69_25050 [Bacillus cereus]MBM6769253.1 toll/interleukin-1 receptor domain-containing protein [Bacillus cereus]MCU5365119.1 toll/interleukin-1 receptor domain-containing protein [Bacillus paranthracis]MDA2192116.1 toll/interleukin-1 receptor domain-containing protein [Bacillus cereus group sp. Bc238]